jgi:putative ABC transport system permease protein
MTSGFDAWLMEFLDSRPRVIASAALLLAVLIAVLYSDQVLLYTRLIVKSLRRNIVRSLLTSLATVVLVLVVTMVWSVLSLLDQITTEKSKDLKAIVTERWQIPSQMPYAYEASLAKGAARKDGDVVPQDSMTWSFVGGTLDPDKQTRENIVFFFAMDPAKMLKAERDKNGNLLRDEKGNIRCTSMMDGIDEMTAEQVDQLDRACREMEKDRRKVVIGKERLAMMQKKVGERIKLTTINYRPVLELELEIVGEFPDGRYNQNAIMSREYLLESLDAFKRKNNGTPHPMADRALNLVWLRVPDTDAFRRVAEQVLSSPEFTTPAVKAETASSGIASFLDAYRDLLWGMRWLLVPAILATMAMVIANAISISVRERRGEMAVLKVLGFRPTQIMVLVLGEAVLLGAGSGFLSALLAFVGINAQGGVKFPIAFFPAFRIPMAALWWGVAIGSGTAIAGSLMPAWSARKVKVAEVFSKIS